MARRLHSALISWQQRSYAWTVWMLVSAVALCALAGTADAQPVRMIRSVAGTGAQGFGGDGGPATAAAFNYPKGVAVDAAGNVFIVDMNNHRVRMLTVATGVITTVAGNGTNGFSGDGGPATAAAMSYPYGVAVDYLGNIYIADLGNQRVRKVTAATGYITTVAGTGNPAFSGDGGPATAAELNGPYAVAADTAGNLYIADSGNYRVRKMAAATGIITTVAGTTYGYGGDGGAATEALMTYPSGIAVDGLGNLYISDSGNYVIRKVTAATGIITTLAGNGTQGYSGDGGLATAAQLTYPGAISVDADRNVYVGDSGDSHVRQITASTGVIETLAGTGTFGYSGDGGPAVDARIANPEGLAMDGNGNLYLASPDYQHVRVITYNVPPEFSPQPVSQSVLVGATATFTVAATGYPDPTFRWQVSTDSGSTWANLTESAPYSGTTTSTLTITGALYALNGRLYRVVATNLGGTVPSDAATLTVVKLTPPITWPAPAAVLPGTVLGPTQLNASTTVPGTIVYIPPAGAVLTAGTDLLLSAVFTPTDGATYAVATVYQTIDVIGITGEGSRIITTFAGSGTPGYAGGAFAGDGGPATSARFNSVHGIALDGAGNVYVADVYNQRVRKIDAVTGIVTTVAGSGPTGPSAGAYGGDGGPATSARLNYPVGVALDQLGNLYIADLDNYRVRKVTAATGIITTVVGTGIAGFSGDDGLATAAQLQAPTAVVLDAAGNLYVADSDNCRIRKVTAATGIITTYAGTGWCGYDGDGGPAISARLYYMAALALDSAGNLYFPDHNNFRVRKVTAATGIITAVAGNGTYGHSGDGGLATDAQLTSPVGVAVDDAGNLTISEWSDSRVRRVNAASGIITTIAGTGTAGFTGDDGLAVAAQLHYPYGLAARGKVLYVADSENNRVRVIAEAAPAAFSTHPGNLDLASGGTGALTSVVSGYPPPTLRWQVSTNGGLTFADVTEGAPYTGVTTAVLTIAAAPLSLNGYQYHVVATNAIGAATSNTATVTVTSSTPIPPVITWATPSSIVYNTAIGAAQLNATASVPGVFVYDPPSGTYLPAGTQTLSVTFTPTDLAHYTITTATVSLLVTKAAPMITWAAPSGIVYGTALGATQLNAAANQPGSFVYTPPAGTVLAAGTRTLSVTFTPTDGANYTTAGASVDLVVAKATPVITWATPAYIYYGTAIGPVQLNATASVAGTFAYNPPAGTILNADTHALTATLTPTDTSNYNVTSASVNQVVLRATPVISWPTPAPVIHGTPLGPDQLNATANVPGSFFYSQAGWVLGLGAGQQLYTAFTPTDTANYDSAWRIITVDVIPFGPVISTIAGTLTPGFLGDGGPALAAQFNEPFGVAVDGAGNVFVADSYNHRVRKISQATGVITTAAGSGEAGSATLGGFAGDGGAATAALFGYVTDVAVDGAGNLYIADTSNHRIRKVDAATGIVTTIAGRGVYAFGGDGGPATSAYLNWPFSVVVDNSGNVYIADSDNSRIRKIDAATGVITTVAGTGAAGFAGDGGAATAARLNSPFGLALDLAGNLYIGDSNNYRVRKLTVATGVITTVAGTGVDTFGGDGGPATEAQIGSPGRLAVDGGGNLIIADTGNNRVREVSAATGVITTIAGTGVYGSSGDGAEAVSALLNLPSAVAVDALGNVYIGEWANYDIRKVSEAAAPTYSLTIAPAPAHGAVGSTSLACGSNGTTCRVSFATPTTVTVTATADPDYLFTGWSGSCSGTNPSTTVTVDAAKTCTATFGPAAPVDGPPYTLTMTRPSGGTVQGAGFNCGDGGATCTVTMPAAMTLGLSATASSGYQFSGWTGDCVGAGSTLWLALNGPRNCGVTFTLIGGGGTLPPGPPYSLTVTRPVGGTVQGAGLNCGDGGGGCTVTMPASMTLGISATASAGYTFAGWTGDCTGTASDLWVALGGPRNCGATFTPSGGTPPYQLTISPAPTGGTVTGNGLACGTGGATCVVTFGSATTASLTATADSGYVFSSWAGACSGTSTGTSVLVNGSKTCSATFTVSGGGPVNGPPYTLTITRPTGGTVQGAGLNCGDGAATCSVTMPATMTLGISAVPSAGYTFAAWTGDCTGTTPGLWVALNGPRTCGATFTGAGAGTIITTYAGSGVTTFGGDGGPATAAGIAQSYGIALDAAGNLYLSDYGNFRVRKVTAATGIITTVAGSGVQGSAGDGGPATSAELGYAVGVATDAAGNLYIADTDNNRVRKVTAATGVISTVAGAGTAGYSGDGGQATAAELNRPYEVAIDGSGNLYVADYGNSCVRKVSGATGIITTIAGTGGVYGFGGDGGQATAAQLNGPLGIALDGAGDLFVADYGNHRVRRVSAATGIITTAVGTGVAGFAGDGGQAGSAQLNYPYSVALDSAGNMVIADVVNNRIRKVTAATGVITTIAGTGVQGFSGDGGPAIDAQLSSPTSVAVDGTGQVFVAEPNNARIRRIGGPAAPVNGPPYTLTLTRSTGGTVQGAGLNCGDAGSTCSVTMPASMTLGIEATPSAGYEFSGWTGDCTGTTPGLWVALNGPRTCTATFRLK